MADKRELVVSGSLLHELMDLAILIGPDKHNPGFNQYRIEFPSRGIGFIVSARDDYYVDNKQVWNVATWSTYNA